MLCKHQVNNERFFAEKPLKTTLTMLEHVTGKILDSEANGEIMLLGDFTTTPTRFYCAVCGNDVFASYVCLFLLVILLTSQN